MRKLFEKFTALNTGDKLIIILVILTAFWSSNQFMYPYTQNDISLQGLVIFVPNAYMSTHLTYTLFMKDRYNKG